MHSDFHVDAFLDGPRRSRNSYKEIYEMYGKPCAIVDKPDREDITRAMIATEVSVFLSKRCV